MKRARIKFKAYQQNQLSAIPPTLEELIPINHPVRVVNQIIDQINLDPLLKKYKGGGSSSYHPRMLLKVLVYGYLSNLYSSRKIEAATKENINFMWLAGMEQPDHNTINRFRTERLKGVIKKVFSQVVILMANSGHVDLQKVYTDGTKIEANANRYTFVWGKRIKTSKERIVKQLEELWEYTQTIASEELKDTAPVCFESMDANEVRKTIEQIDQALSDKPISEEIKKKVKYAKKNWPDKLDDYKKQEEILGKRNSYSKTDTDATFMRMKEDHMQKGQPKPAYNAQISTNNQIITNYSMHQNPTDTKTLKSHMEAFKEQYGTFPKELTADAGYGSEENYEYMEKNKVEAFVKYNNFDQEQHNGNKSQPSFSTDNFHYNKEENCCYCPMGQRMEFKGNIVEKTEAGYQRILSRFKAKNCNKCSKQNICCKTKKNRIIEISLRARELRGKARERLISEAGIAHRKRRPVDVESVFGMLKHNMGFRRFMVRGMENVNIEFGLLALAHNLKKLSGFFNISLIFRPFKYIIQIVNNTMAELSTQFVN